MAAELVSPSRNRLRHFADIFERELVADDSRQPSVPK